MHKLNFPEELSQQHGSETISTILSERTVKMSIR